MGCEINIALGGKTSWVNWKLTRSEIPELFKQGLKILLIDFLPFFYYNSFIDDPFLTRYLTLVSKMIDWLNSKDYFQKNVSNLLQRKCFETLFLSPYNWTNSSTKVLLSETPKWGES